MDKNKLGHRRCRDGGLLLSGGYMQNSEILHDLVKNKAIRLDRGKIFAMVTKFSWILAPSADFQASESPAEAELAAS